MVCLYSTIFPGRLTRYCPSSVPKSFVHDGTSQDFRPGKNPSQINSKNTHKLTKKHTTCIGPESAIFFVNTQYILNIDTGKTLSENKQNEGTTNKSKKLQDFLSSVVESHYIVC